MSVTSERACACLLNRPWERLRSGSLGRPSIMIYDSWVKFMAVLFFLSKSPATIASEVDGGSKVSAFCLC